MEVLLLGTIEVRRGAELVDLGPRRAQRCLLGILAWKADQIVEAGLLADLLWDSTPPENARALIASHLSRLRALLDPRRDGREGIQLLSRGAGYMARLRPDDVDTHRFTTMVAEAEATQAPLSRSRQLRQALSLWRGPLMADAATDRLRDRIGTGLAELRLHAWEMCFEAELALGEHRRVTTELIDAAAANPLREKLIQLLMLALYRGARQGDALGVYRDFRARLVEELGLEPSPLSRQLESAILNNDESLALPGDPQAVVAVAHREAPSELPADIRGFLGRDNELAMLDKALDTAEPGRSVAIVGPPGVGKTALALRWAHSLAEDFPDGQLFVDLRGYGPGAQLSSVAVLERLLRATGVEGTAIPADPDERAALYRSRLADRRMLILLDNVGASRDVRPLLPGSGRSIVVMTSRQRLDGLAVSQGTTRVQLDRLPATESVRLLERFGEVSEHDEAARAQLLVLAELCDHMPLALRIAAVRLVEVQPAQLVEELRNEDSRLGRLSVEDGDISIRATIRLSLTRLPSTARDMFALLGLHPGPRPSLAACAALAGCDLGEARSRMSVIATAHLAQESRDGRYQLHDLVRLYARELIATDSPASDIALKRLFVWYRDEANAADRVLRPKERPNFGSGPSQLGFADAASALAWLDEEADNLVAAVESACVSHPDLGWQIAAAMYGWLTRRQQRDHWIALYQRAAEAAKAVGDLNGEALIIGRVSMPYSQLGMHSEAAACCLRSHELRTAIGDHLGAATAILNLGAVWNNAQDPAAAITALRRAGRMGDALPGAGYLKSLIQFNLGEAYQIAGKLPKAFSHFRQALALAEQHGTPRDAAVMRLGVAKAYRMSGQAREAIANLQAAVELARQAGDALTEAEAHEETGLAYLDGGEPAQAEPHLRRALAAYRAKGHRRTAELQALVADLHLP